jgi:hypothetical protein
LRLQSEKFGQDLGLLPGPGGSKRDVVTARNRWYDLFAPFEVRDDDIMRVFVTVKPLTARKV